MKKNHLFEECIDQSIGENMDSIEVPNMDDVWMNIEHHIEKPQKTYISRKRKLGIVAAIIMFALIHTTINHEGYANYFRCLNFFTQSTSNEMVDIHVDNKTPTENRDIENFASHIKTLENGVSEYTLSIDMAKDISSFMIRQPDYIPDGYNMENVTLQQFEDEILNVKIMYTSKDGSFMLLQEPISGEYAVSLKINDEQGMVIEKIVKGYKYNIIKYNNGLIEIIWDMNEVKFTLQGTLSEEQFLKIATSVSRKNKNE
ncbi:DUF4367 domain-containing protein [Crassaminicella profunda]|uniref:DUF4367 domain-containing protein n=1 Tax=Crassaminicella profunda TaxID=1286698 RepID=UPI001CA775E7|nr:DUF4367 domain-containing protein [Crassaminicella profunda]QZY54908.1 DUF4367 domain-containing protein [Crassaminicella profunda]